MRGLLISAVLLTIAATGLAFRSHVNAGISVVSQQVKEWYPDKYKMELAREHVKRLQTGCADLETRLEDARERLKLTDSAMLTLKRDIEKLERVTADGEQLLKRSDKSFVIGGRKHSRADVKRDLDIRTAKLRRLKIELESHKAMSASLSKAITTGDANLAQAMEHTQLLNARVESLAVELQAARVRGDCSELASELLALTRDDATYGAASGAVEDLAARVKEVDREVRRREAFLQLANGDQIDWDSEPGLADSRLDNAASSEIVGD